METHALPLVVVAAALLLSDGAHAQQHIPGGHLRLGDQCHLKDGRQGVCEQSEHCPQAIRELKQNGIQPTDCFYNHSAPIQCCPEKELAMITEAVVAEPHTARPKQSQNLSSTQCISPAEEFSPTPEEEQSLVRLAEQKCIEYRKYIYELRKSPLLNNEYINISTCAMDREPLIVGEVTASPGEFPHMAIIGHGDRKNNEWLCGGSLVSSRHILTTAHCLRSLNGCSQRVLLGALELNMTDHNSEPQEFEIVRRFQHPGFHSPKRYNNIAILELDREVKFTRFVRPACLYTDYALPENNKGIVTGFGRWHWDDTEGSNIMKKITVPFQSYNECNKTYSTSFRLPNGIDDRTMICADDLEGKAGTCQGDSGGPLQVQDFENCMSKIVGLTSFGKPMCGAKNSPSVYTRVSSYVPWVAKIIWT